MFSHHGWTFCWRWFVLVMNRVYAISFYDSHAFSTCDTCCIHTIYWSNPAPGFIDQLFFEARIRLLQWGIGGNGRGWRLKIRDLRMSRGATAEAEMGYYRYMDKQLRTAKLGNEWTWQLALHPHGCMKVMFEKAPPRPCFGFVTSFECLGVLPLCCW